MKYLGLLFISLVVSACYTVRAPVYTTNGDISCRTDNDCPQNYYCGFKQVDSYAVCKWDGWDHD